MTYESETIQQKPQTKKNERKLLWKQRTPTQTETSLHHAWRTTTTLFVLLAQLTKSCIKYWTQSQATNTRTWQYPGHKECTTLYYVNYCIFYCQDVKWNAFLLKAFGIETPFPSHTEQQMRRGTWKNVLALNFRYYELLHIWII